MNWDQPRFSTPPPAPIAGDALREVQGGAEDLRPSRPRPRPASVGDISTHKTTVPFLKNSHALDSYLLIPIFEEAIGDTGTQLLDHRLRLFIEGFMNE